MRKSRARFLHQRVSEQLLDSLKIKLTFSIVFDDDDVKKITIRTFSETVHQTWFRAAVSTFIHASLSYGFGVKWKVHWLIVSISLRRDVGEMPPLLTDTAHFSLIPLKCKQKLTFFNIFLCKKAFLLHRLFYSTKHNQKEKQNQSQKLINFHMPVIWWVTVLALLQEERKRKKCVKSKKKVLWLLRCLQLWCYHSINT